jgi:hypothetical protein
MNPENQISIEEQIEMLAQVIVNCLLDKLEGEKK